jgi:hypothetical protein
MRRKATSGFVWIALICLPFVVGCDKDKPAAEAPKAESAAPDNPWLTTFNVEPRNFASTGKSKYWILEPGYQCYYEGKKGHNLTITVLNETKAADSVETRVVEEREFEDGKLSEISRNYFALDKATNDLYYFGEDVDTYEDGKVTGHGGTWLSGKDGAKYGLLIPGTAKVGLRYYQERAPKVAMDRAEVVSVTAKLQTPAGTFENCLKTEETSDLESGKSHKCYAPDVGLISDGDLKLVRHGSTSVPGR